jgi:ABC-type Fe3+/spermidine/putrescine transport system ATPase subunit
MALLTVSGVSKKHQSDFVLRDIGFSQERFQKIAIAGETGSGKSTLLKIIAGLIQPDAGEIELDGEKIIGPDEKLVPGHPRIAYVSQHFELPKFLRVEQMLDYANKLSEEEAAALFKICRIDHLLQRKTNELSGGEKQRIALARHLIASPELLLLDEPFSNLDIILKNILKTVIQEIGDRLKITCILVSHDPADTLSWADEILVIKEGQLVQRGTPQTIYRQPVSEYAAGLFGKYTLLTALQAKRFPSLQRLTKPGRSMIIRPENFKMEKEGEETLPGRVKQVTFFGNYYETEILVQQVLITARTEMEPILKNGAIVYLRVPSGEIWYI